MDYADAARRRPAQLHGGTAKGTPCTHNPLGVKGCGEAGAIGSPPAVINAITGAGATVFRSTAMEAALTASMTPGALDGITVPPDDLNNDAEASAEYRAHLCVVMAKRAVAALR
jgi:hypothetical protein